MSSSGVTKVGTNKASTPFTRRMCPNLFAFAKCLQFQVTRKSHLWYDAIAKWSASPAGSAGITLCAMYAATMSAMDYSTGNSRNPRTSSSRSAVRSADSPASSSNTGALVTSS